MPYQSMFAPSGSGTPKASTGSYQSMFGFAVPKNPSQQQLASQQAQKKAQQNAIDAQQKIAKAAQQKQQTAEAKRNSLFGKVKRATAGIIDATKDIGEKTLNTTGAATASIVGSGIEAAQDLTGNKRSAKTTSAATKQEVKQFETDGIGGTGGYYNPKAIKEAGGNPNSFENKYIKPISQAAADIVPYVLPVGKAAEGAKLLTRVVTGAAENAAVSGGTTVANEAINGQLTNKSSAKETAKSLATGALLGGLFPVLHDTAKVGNTGEAKLFLSRAQQDHLLDNVRPRDEVATPEPAVSGETPAPPAPNSMPIGGVVEHPINSVPANVLAESEAQRPVVPEQIAAPAVEKTSVEQTPVSEVSQPSEKQTPVSKPDNVIAVSHEDGSVTHHELTGSALEEYTAAKEQHDKTVATYKNVRPGLDREYAAKRIKAAGYKFAAEKRRITGNLTHKEAGTILDKERSAYVGKDIDVNVNGTTVRGKIASTPAFGNVKVQLEDGTTVSVKHADIPEDRRSDAEILAPHLNRPGVSEYEPPVPEKRMTPVREVIAKKRADLESVKTTSEPPPDTRTTPKVEQVADSKFKSRVYERLQKEQPEALKDDVGYKAINLKEDASKAADIVATDKNKAYRIALGVEDDPSVTSTAVNIAMSEKALEDGNVGLYSQLVKSRSLTQTRRGQEIVAEKGSVTDNSTSRYVKELLQSRLSKLGNGYLDNLGEDANKVVGKASTPAQRAIKEVDKQVATATKIVKRSSNLKIQQAQDLIDSLAC